MPSAEKSICMRFTPRLAGEAIGCNVADSFDAWLLAQYTVTVDRRQI